MKRTSIVSCLLAVGLIAAIAAGTSAAAIDKRGPVRPFGVKGLFTTPGLLAKPYAPGVDSCVVGASNEFAMLYSGLERRRGKTRFLWAITRADFKGRASRGFGRAGTIRTIHGLSGKPLKIVIDTQGRIVVAFATTRKASTPSRVVLARLTSRGRLDSSFGTNGVVDTGMSGRYEISELRQLADGSFVVVQAGGGRNSTFTGAIAVANERGLDSSFGNAGVWTDPNVRPGSVVGDADAIFVSGSFKDPADPNSSGRSGILKLDRRGVLVESWGDRGRFLTGAGVIQMYLGTDGRLSIGAYFEVPGDQEQYNEYHRFLVDASGVAIPSADTKVYEEYELLNELDPQPENFNIHTTFGDDGNFIVAAFGDGKGRYPVDINTITADGPLMKATRRESPSVNVWAVAGADDGKSLLVCGERFSRGKKSHAAAFKLALP